MLIIKGHYISMGQLRFYISSILIISLALFSSCKTHKVMTGAMPVKTGDTTSISDEAVRLIRKSDANRISYTTFTTRIQVEYSDGQQQQDFTAAVRMYRDSLLWISLQGPFNIEGARILITRDTVKLINKLTNEYLVQPVSYLSSVLPIQADIRLLQDFLLGYYMQFSGVETTYRGMEDSLHLLQAESAQMRYRARLYPQNYTLAKSLLTDKMIKQEMSITFDGYSTEQGKPFSTDRAIEIKQGGKTFNLHLSYTKVRVNEALAFPFDIAPGMKQVDRIRF